jgi:hypothetical protein
VGAGVVVLSAVLLQATSMQVAAERTRSLKALFFIGIPLFALIQGTGWPADKLPGLGTLYPARKRANVKKVAAAIMFSRVASCGMKKRAG